MVLTRITQLGVVISLVCLSICIFTFWFFREIQSTRTTIHKNLCCSLFMAEFIFLVGINMTAHKVSRAGRVTGPQRERARARAPAAKGPRKQSFL